MPIFQRSWKPVPEAKGYPWLFFYITRTWLRSLCVTCIVVAITGGFYLWYSQFGTDVAPDSTIGLIFASAGTLCFILAAILYMRHRRSQRRKAGQLNPSLHWHIFLAIMSPALIFMHSFGNFNARTGTYALYGLVALTVSGLVGRLIDRIMPRLLASEVAKMLILQEEWEQRWDSFQYQGVSYGWNRPPVWKPDIQSEQAIVQQAERSAQNEQFYRSVIRYWRLFHIALALLAVGLVSWHLVFVVQLLVFHMG